MRPSLPRQTPETTLRPRLLVFTLGAQGERDRRRLLPRQLSQWELAFHRRCLDSVLEEGRACDLELAVASPNHLPLAPDVRRIPQGGPCFGSRLTAAADVVFDQPGPVLIVGTDSPELSRKHMRRALVELQRDSDQVVVGPATDGGFYLLASSRPIEGLSHIKWCREDTLETLLGLLKDAGRPVLLLPRLSDIDQSADFDAWLSRSRSSSPDADGHWHAFVQLLEDALRDHRRIERLKRAAQVEGLLFRPTPARAPPAAA